jgi:hypothetical protein
VLGQAAVEGEGELVDLAPQPPLGEVGHRGRGCGPVRQGVQHQHAGDAEHVAHDTRELDAGALEQLERAVAFRGQRARQRLSVADQVAQHPDLGRRHEAGAHRPVPDQVGGPLGVLRLGLAPGHVAHVRGVADDEGEDAALERGMHGLPIDTRALHPDVGHAHLEQPLPQGREIPGHGAESARLP